MINNLGNDSPGKDGSVGDVPGDSAEEESSGEESSGEESSEEESSGEGSSGVKDGEGTAGESPKNSKIDHASNQDSENGSESDSDDASAILPHHLCSEDDTDDITDGDNNNSGVRWSRWTPIFVNRV